MNLVSLIEQLTQDTVARSLPAFAAELTLCVTIVAMLLVRLPRLGRKLNSGVLALIGVITALAYVAPWQHLTGTADRSPMLGQELFTGLLVNDEFAVYFRSLLLGFVGLFIVFTWLSGIPDREDSADFYSLVLGATLGMCLMATANHLLIVFLAVEMASVPSYALAGMLKGRRQSSEAALKYAVYGAGAAGIMLYGISLVAGVLGSLHLPTLGVQLAELLDGQMDTGRQAVLVLGGLMIMVGLAFKLSAVPFHFWCPDVFEGASAEVNAFLSIASKAGALALLVRVALGFGFVAGGGATMHPETASRPVVESATLHRVAFRAQEGDGAEEVRRALPMQPSPGTADFNIGLSGALRPARHYMAGLVALLAAVTCTFGNLAAYGQTNIKRLLAYSTIAHAGYLMMPVVAALILADSRPDSAEQAVASLAFYLGTYLFMNLAAFAAVAFLRNTIRSEEIKDYAGLVRTSPGVVICFSAVLLSLLWLPPLAGFAAKFTVFAALADARLWLLLTIAGINTVFSLFYYLRVVKVMCLDPPPDDRGPVFFALSSPAGVYLAAVTLPVIVLGIWWNGLASWAAQATAHLLG